MKIEVKERGSKKFYDEFLYIVSNYQKIIRNPHRKNRGLLYSVIGYGICALIFAVGFAIAYFIDKRTNNTIFIYYRHVWIYNSFKCYMLHSS